MKTILSLLLTLLPISLVAQHLEVEGEIDMKGNKIINVADPTNDQDLVTKAYVDLLEKRIADLEFDISYILGLDSIFDVEGNSYKIVKIGDQYWTAENLRTTKFNDSTEIPLVSNNMDWSILTSPSVCWYDNDTDSLGQIYGALYNYYTVADTNSRNVCPLSWHVPTKDEWWNLIDYLGGRENAGKKMKESGTEHWVAPNLESSNESGFTGLPGGFRSDDGSYSLISSVGAWWSITMTSVDAAWLLYVLDNSAIGVDETGHKNLGVSIRCIKD